MNVGIPDMSHYFSISQSQAQWVTSGFMVAMTAGMLCTPWMLARWGYRQTYQACMWMLLIGGICGGISPIYAGTLAARVAEGLAAGIVQPIPVVIIMHAFSPEERGRASGFFGTGVVLAPAIGPSIGGLLVDTFGWRSIFFMVVPLSMIALWLARIYVPTSAPGDATPGEGSGKLDFMGLALAITGIVMLLIGLVEWHEHGIETGLTLLLIAALDGGIFVYWQLRLQRRFQHHATDARPPLMDLRVFKNRSFLMGTIVAITYGTALFGSTYLLPVYMQSGLNLSASYVGTVLLPAGLMLALTITIVGNWADKKSKHHLVIVGLSLLALSFALIGTTNPSHGLLGLWLWVILGRIGLGFILPSLNLGAMSQLPSHLISQGSSTINFMRMLGGAVGVSLCAIVLEWRLNSIGISNLSLADPSTRLIAFSETFYFLAALTALAIWPALRLKGQ